AAEGVLEQDEGAAVEARGDGDGVAGAGEVEDRQGDRALPGGEQQARRPTLERGDAILDRRLGGGGGGGGEGGGLGGRDATGAGEVGGRQGDRALPGGEQQARRPTLERGDAILDRRLGGVGDAGVDGCGLGEREAIRGGLRRGEHEARGLVDRQRARARIGVG